jgi:hypothetical protein
MSKHRSKEKSPTLPKDVSFSTDEELDEMEADPRFQELMRQADEDEREGRWVTNEELLRRTAEAHARRR